jgi:transcription elongation GreA/GreB family factor
MTSTPDKMKTEIQSPIAYRLFEKAVNEELTLVLQKRRRESPTSLEVG